MHILRIEHPVSDYDRWKKVFDSASSLREQSNVRRYRVARAVENPNLVLIDLEFDDFSEVEAMHTNLLGLWSRVEAEGLISGPKARIVEMVESKEY